MTSVSLVWFGLVWSGLVWFGLVFLLPRTFPPVPRARRKWVNPWAITPDLFHPMSEAKEVWKFSSPVLRIWDFYPRSPIRIFPSRIQGKKDSGSRIRIRIEEFKYFEPKKLFVSSRKYDPGCSSWIPQILISYKHCCGYVMFIPDPGLTRPVSRSASKNFCIFNPKNWYKNTQTPDPVPGFFPILDQNWVKKNTRSRIRIRNTGYKLLALY
jgi:hypothetical protein